MRRLHRRVRRGLEQCAGEQVVAPAESSGGPFVALGPARGDRRDGSPGLAEPDRDALAGQRVDVAGGVADEQHAAGRAPTGALAQRSGTEHLGARARQPFAQQREALEQVLERRHPIGEQGDADLVVADRRDVGLGVARPVHLDVRRPRRLRDVAAQPVAAAAGLGAVESEQPPDGGVQTVGRDEVAGRLAVDQHVPADLCDGVHAPALHHHAYLLEAVGEGVVQRRAAHARGRGRTGTQPPRDDARRRSGCRRSADRSAARRGRSGRRRRRASGPRRRPCRWARRAVRGRRRRGRRERRRGRSPGRSGRPPPRSGHASASLAFVQPPAGSPARRSRSGSARGAGRRWRP